MLEKYITDVTHSCSNSTAKEYIRDAPASHLKKETVKAFLQTMPKTVKNTLKSVYYDINEGFINAAKETFGKGTKIVVDRFHVAKLYRKGLDTLRIKELKRLKEELPNRRICQVERCNVGLKKE